MAVNTPPRRGVGGIGAAPPGPSGAAPSPAVTREPGFYNESIDPSQFGLTDPNKDLARGAGYTWDPVQGSYGRSAAQRGTDAGQSLRALQEASGLNLLGSSSSSAGGAGGVGNLPAISMPDTSAANAAAFGRAKDQAGQTSRASLTALRNEMAGRGLRGSGIEAGEVGDIISRGAGDVNEFTREQALSDVKQAGSRATQEYEGRITQRGQDISMAQGDANRQQQRLDGLLGLIGGGRGILY